MFNWLKKKVNPVPVAIEDVIASPFPKVLKEPKLKATTCRFCKCVYQPEARHLRPGMFSLGVRKITECPICKEENMAEFEDVIEETQDANK